MAGCGQEEKPKSDSPFEKYGGVKISGSTHPWDGPMTGTCRISIEQPEEGARLPAKDPIECVVRVEVSAKEYLPTYIKVRIAWNGGQSPAYYPDLIHEDGNVYLYRTEIGARSNAGAYTIVTVGIDDLQKAERVYSMDDIKEVERCSDQVSIQLR